MSNGICLYLWWCNNILEITQANNGSYLFKSFRNSCTSWSNSWMCMAKVNDSTYSKKHVDYLPLEAMQPSYMKIIMLVLHKLKEDSQKVTKLSISPLNSSIFTSSMKKSEIDVQQIQSCNNLADLFTKTLPSTTLKKLRYDIRMWRLRDLPIEILKKS